MLTKKRFQASRRRPQQRLGLPSIAAPRSVGDGAAVWELVGSPEALRGKKRLGVS